MSLLVEQVDRAKARAAASGLNLTALVETTRGAPPGALASPGELDDRRRLLERTLPDPELAEKAFERIIEGNELQPVNYLELGVLAAAAVCRIDLTDATGRHCGWGTGFLIAPGVLLTNNHVFPGASLARRSVAQFDVELNALGEPKAIAAFALDPDALFHTSPELDFAVVAVAPTGSGGEALSAYGFLPLIGAVGKVVEGEWLTIIQHPEGKLKQVCVRENRLLKRADDVLWYSTDTLGGSSGSPVFNNSWQVVALHHKGVPEEVRGYWQTVDGRNYDPARDREDTIKWIANEGIRVSRIVDTLKAALPGEPRLAEVFDMTPERARQITQARLAALPPPALATPLSPTPPARSESATGRSITLTLDLADDGGVSVRPAGGARESLMERAGPAPAASHDEQTIDIEVPFDDDYSAAGKRKGYDPGLLKNGYSVPLPDVADLTKIATPKIDAPPAPGKAAFVLDYLGYSAVMHAKRRLAIFTAANVEGGRRFNMKRPPDTWRYDPRIPRAAQIANFYYAKNQFDRGHLTRREDMEFGDKPLAAVEQAADTCHWTNCTPMHAKFNQNKETWQGLERHVLENSIEANVFGAQVFTGPILDEGDPVWDKFPEIQYPSRFWKVAVALTASNKLFAAGFILDQSDAIAQFGIEAAVEVPFGTFKTYQVKIAEIEQLTGLTFKYAKGAKSFSLRTVDPMETPAAQVRLRLARTRARTGEAFGGDATPAGYLLLDGPAAIVRPEP